MDSFLAAAVQLNSGPDKARNLEAAREQVELAASRGAQFIALPENFSWMGPETDRRKDAEDVEGPTLQTVAQWAKWLEVHLLAGSILEKDAPAGKLYNTSVLFDPQGRRLATYRKMHLFDVVLENGTAYRESDAVASGTEVTTAKTGLGNFGLSVCYDLRFPELYRALGKAGAEVLCVPSAFTAETGAAHWEVLLRARAVENLCYVIAPAQVGTHGEKRKTFGHAMVISHWGEILSCAKAGVGFAIAEIDLGALHATRLRFPVLDHRRL